MTATILLGEEDRAWFAERLRAALEAYPLVRGAVEPRSAAAFHNCNVYRDNREELQNIIISAGKANAQHGIILSRKLARRKSPEEDLSVSRVTAYHQVWFAISQSEFPCVRVKVGLAKKLSGLDAMVDLRSGAVVYLRRIENSVVRCDIQEDGTMLVVVSIPGSVNAVQTEMLFAQSMKPGSTKFAGRNQQFKIDAIGCYAVKK